MMTTIVYFSNTYYKTERKGADGSSTIGCTVRPIASKSLKHVDVTGVLEFSDSDKIAPLTVRMEDGVEIMITMVAHHIGDEKCSFATSVEQLDKSGKPTAKYQVCSFLPNVFAEKAGKDSTHFDRIIVGVSPDERDEYFISIRPNPRYQ